MKRFILLAVLMVFVGFWGYEASPAEQAAAQSLISGNPPLHWVPRLQQGGKNLWIIGHAELDPADSTRFIVTPNGKELVNAGHGSVDLYTTEKFGDVHLDLEFMIPVNGNSGVQLMGEYEVQIWESFSKAILFANQWMGTIVATAEPKVHPEKGGGEWQTLSVDFRAPRFNTAGEKIANARFIKVVLNGVVIHENIEVPAPTPVCLTCKESEQGPLMLQGFAGPVAFRNIRIKPRNFK